MTTFIWTVAALNAVVALMALSNAAADEAAKKRALFAGAVLLHGAIALWGFWLVLA